MPKKAPRGYCLCNSFMRRPNISNKVLPKKIIKFSEIMIFRHNICNFETENLLKQPMRLQWQS